ncbi:unannotated protein [freshwater metagenome]|uniref:Unannotated protein n=1 Tax=freshwater metagenome TaxID=449393 RepID=A0A6J7E4N4_9ZZZZ
MFLGCAISTRKPMWRALVFAALALMGNVVVARPASASAGFRAAVERTAFIDAGLPAESMVRVTVGPFSERRAYRVKTYFPRYRTWIDGFRRREGSFFEMRGGVHLDTLASGTWKATSTLIMAIPCTPTYRLRPHGYEPKDDEGILTLPPQSVATLSVRIAHGLLAPQAESDRRAGLIFDAVDGREHVVVTAPVIDRAVRTSGVPRIMSLPAITYSNLAHVRVLRPRRTLRMSGRWRSGVAARLALKVLAPGELRARTVGRVVSERDGSFQFAPYRPVRHGRYEISIAEVAPRSDETCPMSFDVRAAS